MIDTSAADNGSVDAILNDANEMALGWYSAVTGKGIATGRTQGGAAYTIGLAPLTQPQSTQLVQATEQATQPSVYATPVFQDPAVLIALVVAAVVVGVLLMK